MASALVNFPAPRSERIRIASALAAPTIPDRPRSDPPAQRMPERIRTGTFDNGVIAGRAWFLPYHDGITAETPTQRAAYPGMLRSPAVKSALYAKIMAVASLDRQIQAENADSPREQEASDFLRFNLDRLPEGFPAAVAAMLLPMLIDGKQVTEPVLAIEEQDARFKSNIVLAALKPKHRDTYDLEIDTHQNVIGIRGLGPNQGQTWPIGDFVYSRYMPVYDDPLGTSDLRAAYSPYWFRDTVTKLRALAAERSTGSIQVATYTNVADKDDVDAALTRAKTNTWMSIPEGVKVETLNLASSGEADWKSFIDDCDKQILIAIAGAYLQVLEGQVSNARGSAAVGKSVSELFQWYLAVTVQEIFNKQIFPLLMRYRYPGLPCPKLTLGGVSEDEIAKIIVNLQGLQSLGLKLSAKDAAKRTSAQIATTEDDVLKATAQPAPGGFGFGQPQQFASPSAAVAPQTHQFAEPWQARNKYGVKASGVMANALAMLAATHGAGAFRSGHAMLSDCIPAASGASRRFQAFADVSETHLPHLMNDLRLSLRRYAAVNRLPMPLVTDQQILAALEASLPEGSDA